LCTELGPAQCYSHRPGVGFRPRQSLPTTRCSDSYSHGSPSCCRFPIAPGCRVTPHAPHRPRVMRCRPYPLVGMASSKRRIPLLPLRSPLLTPRVLRDAAPQPPAAGILSPPRASPGPRAAPQPGYRPPDHLHKLPLSVPHQPPSASMWTGHSAHPSTPSPPPRAPQPLRGPHRLPRSVVHLYRRRSPPLTRAAVDGLTGEHPAAPNGFPISLCRSSRRPRPTPPSWIAGNRPVPPPVAMELPPLPLFDHGPPAHGWPPA
jgi:hypothetical protein